MKKELKKLKKKSKEVRYIEIGRILDMIRKLPLKEQRILFGTLEEIYK
ncbi:MAG: hypothetical protein ACYTBZ_24360 [Planctomycetota bacterium]